MRQRTVVGVCALLASCVAQPSSQSSSSRVAEAQRRFHDVLGGPSVPNAHVELPRRANDYARVEDPRSMLALRFALEGTNDAPVEHTDGLALYAGALHGADVIHRVHENGTEDFVLYEQKPERESLDYTVDISAFAGVRLVSNVLEFLDPTGHPRLRMAAPYVASEDGSRSSAVTSVTGCAYDTNPTAPWGRPVTPPQTTTCHVHVSWNDVHYPALVDPNWVGTALMNARRSYHSATMLADGRTVLLSGGINYQTTAELFDGELSFAATGATTTIRYSSTATLLADGRVLITGGIISPSSDPQKTAEIYENGTFRLLTAEMSVGRDNHTATLLPSGKVLIAGGQTLAINGYSRTAELWNGTSFESTGDMAGIHAHHETVLLPSGKALVIGGISQTAELYDNGAFSPAGTLIAESRIDFSATLLPSGKILIAGGSSSVDAEIWSNGAFTQAPAMVERRSSHRATLLRTGKVLLTGGYLGEPIRSAEIYDEASGFVAATPILQGRWGHTSTLLASGKVLITGGAGLLDGEIYDLKADGGSCATGTDCVSGICDPGGTCCSTAAAACTGTCMACAKDTGACAPVRNAPDVDTCTGTNACDATGACVENRVCTIDTNCLAGFYCDATNHCAAQKAPGASCTRTAMCTAGACADGVCCNSACTGQCEACDVAGREGTCTPALGAPHGTRPACRGDGTICGQCDGKTGAACTLLPATSSCKIACSAAAETESTCDGQGACIAGAARACANNLACDGAGQRCKTSCAADADCATGFLCRGGACVPGGASCVAGHIATSADGTTRDCAPFNCESNGACKTECSSVNDCVSPSICSSAHKCVSPATTSGSDAGSSGCSSSPQRGTHDGGWIAMFLLGAMLRSRLERREERNKLGARTEAKLSERAL